MVTISCHVIMKKRRNKKLDFWKSLVSNGDYHRSNFMLRQLDVLIRDCFGKNDECMETPKIESYLHRKRIETYCHWNMDFCNLINGAIIF